MSDGKIIIGTEVDESGVDKGIKDIEKKKVKQKEIKIDSNVDDIKKEFKELNKEFENLLDKRTKIFETINDPSSNTEQIKNAQEKLQTTGNRLREITSQKNELEQRIREIETEQNKELQEQTEEIEKQNKLLEERANEQKKSEITPDLEDVEEKSNKIGTIFSKIFNKTSDIIGNIGKVALKIVGIGASMIALTGAATIFGKALSDAFKDTQLLTDIKYIIFSIGQAIEAIASKLAQKIIPLLQEVVNWVAKILQYVNYIVYKWFNINLFANATAKAFKEANAKASKLKKTLASFDEMNILNKDDNSTTSIGIPSFDLTSFKNVEIPKWIKWIADNKETILIVLGALAATFAAETIAKWITNLGGLQTALGFGSTGVLGLLSSIATFGAIAITIYIAKKWYDDVQEFRKELDEISKRGAKAQESWIDKETDINKLIQTGNVNREAGYQILKDSESPLAKISGLSKTLVADAKQTAINIGKQIDKEYELYKTTDLTEDEQKDLLNNIMRQVEYNKKVIQYLEDEGEETEDLKKMNKKLAEYGDDIYKNIYKTNNKLYDVNKMKLNDKTLKVKIDADTTKAEKKTSSWTSGILKALGKITLSGYGFWGRLAGGILFNRKGAIYYPPRLASGGIINMPNRGVPLGSAVAGESGAEGVIPLTDSQQMDLLGEAIGRHITINATVVNSMNGRVLSREIQKVQNESNFAMNR